MSYRSWMVRFALAAAFVLGIAGLATTVDVPTVSSTPRPAAEMTIPDQGDATTAADVTFAVKRGQEKDVVEQTVVCLLIPECFRNADCDPACGERQGRCVHNTCPARVCRCR